MRWLDLIGDCIGAVAVFATPLIALYVAYGLGLT
jgi:hypothetical protein